jgi:hypothetical protein
MVGAANYKRGGFVIAVTLGGILKVQSAPGRIGRLYVRRERKREKIGAAETNFSSAQTIIRGGV